MDPAPPSASKRNSARGLGSWFWEPISHPEVLLGTAFLAVVLVYIRAITYDFVFDDYFQVLMNPWISSWGGLKHIFTQHSWAFANFPVPSRYYRPIFLLWLWAIRMVSNGAPGWFHLAAVLTHLAVTWLVFLLAGHLLQERRAAAIAALLFALHPSKIEAVAWISGAGEAVHAAFFFGVFVAYFCWRENPRWYWLFASVASFGAAIFAKETAVLAPMLVLTYHWLAAAPGSSERNWRRLALLAAPYTAVGTAYFVIRMHIIGGVAEVPGLSAEKTVYTIPLAFCWFVKQVVWPFRLSVYYPALIVRRPELVRFFGVAALLALFAALFWAWARKSAELKFLFLWFVATLLPVLGAILLLQPHDRYLYLPSFAFAVMVAKLLSGWKPKPALAAALALALVYAATTFVEEQYWESDLRLFTRGVETAPELPRARELLSAAYADAGNAQMALKVVQEGYERAPGNPGMSYALALAYYNRAAYDSAATFFRHTLESGPDKRLRAMSSYYLGRIAERQAHPQEAEIFLRQAIESSPANTEFHGALANLLKGEGRAAEAARELALAGAKRENYGTP